MAYDAAKAHEYYEAHKTLKGRRRKQKRTIRGTQSIGRKEQQRSSRLPSKAATKRRFDISTPDRKERFAHVIEDLQRKCENLPEERKKEVKQQIQRIIDSIK